MAYPASTVALSKAVNEAHEIMLAVKQAAVSLRDNSASGDVTASAVLSMRSRCVDSLARLNAIASMPGIGERAKSEVNDPDLDVGVEFNAVTTEMAAVRDWIEANFPKHQGWLLRESFTEVRKFTTAQTADLRAALDGLIATIA